MVVGRRELKKRIEVGEVAAWEHLAAAVVVLGFGQTEAARAVAVVVETNAAAVVVEVVEMIVMDSDRNFQEMEQPVKGERGGVDEVGKHFERCS